MKTFVELLLHLFCRKWI